MIIKLTLKHSQLSEKNIGMINHYIDKITQMLPHYSEDLPLLAITIRQDKSFYSPKKVSDNKNIKRKTGIASFYEGSTTLHLPKNPIDIHFRGKTIDECLNMGFDSLLEKIKKFKDKHFHSESQYPNYSAISKVRGMVE